MDWNRQTQASHFTPLPSNIMQGCGWVSKCCCIVEKALKCVEQRELVTSNIQMRISVVHKVASSHEWGVCDQCGEGKK